MVVVLYYGVKKFSISGLPQCSRRPTLFLIGVQAKALFLDCILWLILFTSNIPFGSHVETKYL
jgi:hypothetical protein